jgi:DNA-binding MarR family transcriptional regulator
MGNEMPIFSKGARGRNLPSNTAGLADDAIIGAVVDYELRARSLRSAIFDFSVINDSSWPIVQRLFHAHLNRFKMRVKELYVESALPQTTVLRYLDHLEKCEVVRREDDPSDSRATLVSLTDSAADWLREYYSQIVEGERSLAEQAIGLFNRPFH